MANRHTGRQERWFGETERRTASQDDNQIDTGLQTFGGGGGRKGVLKPGANTITFEQTQSLCLIILAKQIVSRCEAGF